MSTLREQRDVSMSLLPEAVIRSVLVPAAVFAATATLMPANNATMAMWLTAMDVLQLVKMKVLLAEMESSRVLKAANGPEICARIRRLACPPMIGSAEIIVNAMTRDLNAATAFVKIPRKMLQTVRRIAEAHHVLKDFLASSRMEFVPPDKLSNVQGSSATALPVLFVVNALEVLRAATECRTRAKNATMETQLMATAVHLPAK